MPKVKNKIPNDGIEIFFDLLNAESIDGDFIRVLKNKSEPFLRCTEEHSIAELIDQMSEIRSELLPFVIAIAIDPVKNINSAVELAQWCSDQIKPSLSCGFDLKFQLNEENEIPYDPYSIIASELYLTFTTVSLDHVKCCKQCKKYFLSERANGQFCSSKCMKDFDRIVNKKKYVAIVRKRRIKGIYIPKVEFQCYECKKMVTKAFLLKKGWFKRQEIICPHCKYITFNPYSISR